ncbi:MAG: DUF1801 domain-containing protein [Arcicella sp.]|jgi:uncharacterized protein YdhG (YjbR/CyaY superfamily)|nr:DUF1801 domain-containing protein [Arcicella sp.]
MQSKAETIEQYLQELPDDRRIVIEKLREQLLKNLPEGFTETMNYGMIGYVVPHSIYPKGYHTTPHLPLPFINIASQKNFIAFYHMSISGDNQLLTWFTDEYAKFSKNKLDMGKSCIRFKNLNQIPYDLLGELAQKVSVQQWIDIYEAQLQENK